MTIAVEVGNVDIFRTRIGIIFSFVLGQFARADFGSNFSPSALAVTEEYITAVAVVTDGKVKIAVFIDVYKFQAAATRSVPDLGYGW